ncbi:LCP family protein [Alkalicoccus daliensis]|uniref:Transcriptional attenuator, LytR family n=1 Tax=Alkalicoccus daliensis TaxID=745820 RepID=A0A1H0GHB9_9BACI|nr:LCP family protein [Alkalicoccus daliensis]SDO06274.1 transcriptional attenuator, LytR family [Alkalicoccus daliensis]
MQPSRMDKKKSRNNSGKQSRPILKIMVLSFLILLLLAGGALAYVVNQVQNVTSESQVELERGDQSEYRDAEVKPDIDPVSVLFLGLDTRDGDLSGRTDAMVLATFNPDESTIQMVNIPRDTRVPIPGRMEEDKINHAHAYGGIDLTVDTVEQFFEIPVDYFVSLNFDAFMEIIDELGGVTVDSPMAFSETDNATYGTIIINEGVQTLDGEEALAYVRMRKQDPDGDLGRGERQKEVMASVVRELASFNSIANFNSLLNTIGRNLNTNVDFSEIVDMHAYASELDNIESLTYEGEGVMIGGVYYYEADDYSLERTRQLLQQHLGMIEEIDPQYSEPLERDEEESGSGEPNLELDGNNAEAPDGTEDTDTTSPEENPGEDSTTEQENTWDTETENNGAVMN